MSSSARVAEQRLRPVRAARSRAPRPPATRIDHAQLVQRRLGNGALAALDGAPLDAALSAGPGGSGVSAPFAGSTVWRECACETPAGGGGCGCAGAEAAVVAPDVEAAILVSHEGGTRLPAPTAAAFGAALGADVSDVRVHADARAASLTEALGASAFTVGRSVWFGAGRFAPQTPEGHALLAHELAHVAQNGTAPLRAPLRLGRPDAPAEVEARRLGAGRRDATAPRRQEAGVVRRQPVLTPPAAPPPPCGSEWRRPGDPDRFLEFRGEIEHALVQIDFMASPRRRAEWSIPGASKRETGHSGFADAVDLGTNAIWEIKPENLELMAGTEAARYVGFANMTCNPRGAWTAGTSYVPNSTPIFQYPGFRLFARQGVSGAILYRWQFDPEFLALYSVAFLADWARRTARDVVFGRSSGVEPGKVPALAFAPLAVQAIVPALRWVAGVSTALALQLARAMGVRVPVGTTVAILVPEHIWIATAGTAMVADRLAQMRVPTDPQQQLARELALVLVKAFGPAAAGVLVMLGVAGAVIAVFVANPPAATAAAAEAPALAPALAGAAAGMLVFVTARTAAADDRGPRLEGPLLPTLHRVPPASSVALGDEITKDGRKLYVVGVAVA